MAAMGVGAEVLRGDAELLPFADATFDRASSNGVLHHTPDMPAALREIHRVLQPGGTATIIVYHRDSLFFWVSRCCGWASCTAGCSESARPTSWPMASSRPALMRGLWCGSTAAGSYAG